MKNQARVKTVETEPGFFGPHPCGAKNPSIHTRTSAYGLGFELKQHRKPVS
jgi:hypothetical protein